MRLEANAEGSHLKGQRAREALKDLSFAAVLGSGKRRNCRLARGVRVERCSSQRWQPHHQRRITTGLHDPSHHVSKPHCAQLVFRLAFMMGTACNRHQAICRVRKCYREPQDNQWHRVTDMLMILTVQRLSSRRSPDSGLRGAFQTSWYQSTSTK